MSVTTYMLITILAGIAGMSVGLAMLFLVMWQAGRVLQNQLMGAYMGITTFWGLTVSAQQISIILGRDPVLFFYGNLIAIIATVIILLALTANATNQLQYPFWRIYLGGGVLSVPILVYLLLQEQIVLYLGVNESTGASLYQITTIGYGAYFYLYSFLFLSLYLGLRYYTPQAHYFVVGSALISCGLLVGFFLPTLGNYPITILTATGSAIFFAYTIIRDNYMNPLINLNQQLEQANARLVETIRDAQQKEANLRSLLEATTDLIWSIDAQLNVVTMNSTTALFYERMYNTSNPIQVGDNAFKGAPPRYQKEWEALYYRALAGEPFSIEKKYYITDNQQAVYLEIVFNPIFNEQNEVTGVSIFARNVTARKEAEQQLKLQALTFENLSESVIITNLDGLITDCNAATETIFGYSKQELVGQMPEIWHAPDSAPMTDTILDGLARDGRWVGEIRFVRKNGQYGICEALVLPLYDETGRRIAALGVSRDITKDKQHEAELREAKEAAESANRAKSAFLASMSHELRTPLNAIIGYGEMLEDIALDQGYGEMTPDLERITTAGRHLLSLINDILDLSKIEAGKMTIHAEQFLVSDLIQDVLASSYPLAQKNNNQLKVEQEGNLGLMFTDIVKVRQILLNLLSNAAKFTQKGQIILRVEPDPAAEEFLLFSVKDSGIGMTAEETKKIFNAFTQADASTTRKFGGTGLGLTLCYRFCELMGGQITVVSQPGVGSTFTVRLPQKYTPPADGAKKTSSIRHPLTNTPTHSTTIRRTAPHHGTILIIDETAEDREQMVRWLYQARYRVYAASNGSKALKLAPKLKPVLIFLQQELQEMSYKEVLLYLKALPELNETHIVLMGGQSNGSSDNYPILAKPFTQEKLLKTIQTIQGTPAPAEGLLDKRVMIVDDSPIVRDVLRLALQKEGLEVQEAINALMALEILDNPPFPHLIVIDLMLPEMDGFELIDRLKTMPHTQNIPIIVITAKQLTDEEQTRLSHSALYVLQKGFFSHIELAHRINDIVQKQLPNQTHTL